MSMFLAQASLLLCITAEVLANSGHHHHHEGEAEHEDHHQHHHNHDTFEDDFGLEELIQSFGFKVLGKDQESASDTKPSEDHKHLNIKAIIEELFHPSTTQKTTSTSTLPTTSTEKLPIKDHLHWDRSPVDLVMSDANNLVEPVFDSKEEELAQLVHNHVDTSRRGRKHEFPHTTQPPVYLTETHYYFPGRANNKHEEDLYAPIEDERAPKHLDIQLDVSQLIDKPTIPVVDTRLANFLLVHRKNKGSTTTTRPPRKSTRKQRNRSQQNGRRGKTIRINGRFVSKRTGSHQNRNIPFISTGRQNRRNNNKKLPRTRKKFNNRISRELNKKFIYEDEVFPIPQSKTSGDVFDWFASLDISIINDTDDQHQNLKNKQRGKSHRKEIHNFTVDILKEVQTDESGESSFEKGVFESNNILPQGSKYDGQDKHDIEPVILHNFNGISLNEARLKKESSHMLCQDLEEGLYADVINGCKSFTMCHSNGRSGKFYCPFGTKFSQDLGICDWKEKVVC